MKKMTCTISKPKFAIFSDLHLGVHSNSSEWHNYAIEWAYWFKDECKKKNIKDLRTPSLEKKNNSSCSSL